MDEEESGETIYHARLVAVLCFSLSSVISIWSQGQRPHLTESQRNQSFFLGNLFCSCYSALARNAFDRKLPLYRIRPKHHYWVHLLDYMHVSSVNPMATSNFLDEDMMKAMRGVAKACHPKTVKVSWSKRYILKRVISWGKSSNEWSAAPQRGKTHGEQFFHDAFLFAAYTHDNLKCSMKSHYNFSLNIYHRFFMYKYVFFGQRKFSVAGKFPIYELSWSFL